MKFNKIAILSVFGVVFATVQVHIYFSKHITSNIFCFVFQLDVKSKNIFLSVIQYYIRIQSITIATIRKIQKCFQQLTRKFRKVVELSKVLLFDVHIH